MIPLKQHLNNIPDVLVDALQEEFQKLHTQYFLGSWEPSQMNGGRFAEAVLRIVEYKNSNGFTPIGTQINRQAIISSAEQNTNLDESYRFHIRSINNKFKIYFF